MSTATHTAPVTDPCEACGQSRTTEGDDDFCPSCLALMATMRARIDRASALSPTKLDAMHGEIDSAASLLPAAIDEANIATSTYGG